jgi:hypothetical protein
LTCVTARVHVTWNLFALSKVAMRKSPGASGNAVSVVTGLASSSEVSTGFWPRVNVVAYRSGPQLDYGRNGHDGLFSREV